MKNILTAAAMIILTILVVVVAANLHGHAHDTCTQEWTSIPADQHGITKN